MMAVRDGQANGSRLETTFLKYPNDLLPKPERAHEVVLVIGQLHLRRFISNQKMVTGISFEELAIALE